MKIILYFIIIYSILCFIIYYRSIHLWDSVCQKWFPFHQHLSIQELKYVKTCQKYLLFEYLLRPIVIWFQPYLPYLSNFTYAFEWNSIDKIQRGRFGYGLASGIFSGRIESMAKNILSDYNIDLPKDTGVFYGLAWNFHDKTIRCYYKQTREELKENLEIECYEVGLRAWTWKMETGELVDEKDYLFDRNKNGAWMFSTKRNQWIFQSNDIPKDIPFDTQTEIQFWNDELGFSLDTVSHWDNQWVFYFPHIHLFK